MFFAESIKCTPNSYFKNLQDLPVSMLPGNHEYYTTAASGYDSPDIYNQYFNNPQNSFEGRIHF